MKALKAKKQILRTQISNARSRNNERQLEKALQRYFKSLEKQVQRNLQFYWQDNNLLVGQVDLITEPIMNNHDKYYEIIEKYLLREYELGSQEAERLVIRLNRNRIANKAKVKKPEENPNLQNEFTKDFYTLVNNAEGNRGIELKPIYNKLKKKYKSKVKNRAEFEKLFTKAVMGTSTRLYPSRYSDMFVKIGGRNFSYIDRSNLTKPKLTGPFVEESEVEEQKVTIPKPETDTPVTIDDQYNLFGTLGGAEDDLLTRTFEASRSTLMRVDQSIKVIITDGYKTGNGINYVANKIRERFGQLQGWESKRIARTEIHNAHNRAVMDTYKEYDVQYTMWISAHDDRVRGLKPTDTADHVKLDGEIIRLGDTYSNGLKYPGDTDGPLVEWINCRCSNAPYVIPYPYVAPNFSPFREEDLIKVERKG